MQELLSYRFSSDLEEFIVFFLEDIARPETELANGYGIYHYIIEYGTLELV